MILVLQGKIIKFSHLSVAGVSSRNEVKVFIWITQNEFSRIFSSPLNNCIDEESKVSGEPFLFDI